ncbi:MAG: Hpt domain-containing protein [Magnetococcus sp. YQC-5]
METMEPPPPFDGGQKIRLLREEVGGYVKDLIDQFLVTLPDRIDSLANAICVKDFALVQLEAHKLKGAAAILGAEQMAHICNQLEQQCQAGQSLKPDLLPTLLANVQFVTEALEQCRGTEPTTPQGWSMREKG